jgi:hypothetical protein
VPDRGEGLDDRLDLLAAVASPAASVIAWMSALLLIALAFLDSAFFEVAISHSSQDSPAQSAPTCDANNHKPPIGSSTE